MKKNNESEDDMLKRLNSAKSKEYNTFLFDAAERGYIEVIKKLIAIPGIDLNVYNKYGYTPAAEALEYDTSDAWGNDSNHDDIIKLLIYAGGYINYSNFVKSLFIELDKKFIHIK